MSRFGWLRALSRPAKKMNFGCFLFISLGSAGSICHPMIGEADFSFLNMKVVCHQYQFAEIVG